jgi:hypothetical protein
MLTKTGKISNFKNFEKMIKTCLLPQKMFYASYKESKTYHDKIKKKIMEEKIKKLEETKQKKNTLRTSSIVSDNYKKELNSLGKLNENQKYSYAHKHMFLHLPNLNLLTYKKYVPPPINPEEEEMLNRVNFKKLLPYSRLGKNLGYSQKNFREKNKNNAFITEPRFAFSTNYGDYMKNVKNTNEIVFNTANKELNMKSRINRKRKIIEDMLGVNNIPQLDSYEVMIKDIFNKRKKERALKNKNNMFDIKKEEETFYDKANQKIIKGFNVLNDIEKKIHAYTQDSFNKK